MSHKNAAIFSKSFRFNTKFIKDIVIFEMIQ